MTLGTILLIILIVLLIGAIPSWPYSRDWGYYPSGGLGVALVVILILLLMGQIWRPCDRRSILKRRPALCGPAFFMSKRRAK